ncbi:UPF0587 protein GA18326 [Phlebotomus papatasi]|uniref:UPF0587 protein GA18326 n=1 Tax=Phlebotomus papatasi TaxID=29031 RepID=UPI002483AD39|nr:UPF0587 protein GA18326 [Phlebotomus papatasi]
MVKIGVQICATLENVEELKTSHPNYAFFFKLRCNNCGESSDKFHDVTEADTVNADSRCPRGYNFYAKCKLCNRENTVDIVEGSNVSYLAEDSGKFKTIVTLDCRGLEPTDFLPKSGWIVKAAEGGPTFEEDVGFDEDDWTDYDTKNSVSVGVYEFKSNFVKLKK